MNPDFVQEPITVQIKKSQNLKRITILLKTKIALKQYVQYTLKRLRLLHPVIDSGIANWNMIVFV